MDHIIIEVWHILYSKAENMAVILNLKNLIEHAIIVFNIKHC